MDKVDCGGSDLVAHPLFVYLRKQALGLLGEMIVWNFTKFLCDHNGIPIKRYGPQSSPLSFEKDIRTLLQKDIGNSADSSAEL